MVQKYLSILLLGIALFTLNVAYAETLNLQYETDYLNSTLTMESNQTNSDGTFSLFKIVSFHYLYPNATVALQNPDPVKSDPAGEFFDILLGDFAKIFTSSVPNIPILSEIIVIEEEEEEPEIVYTVEEQEIIDMLEENCGDLSVRLNLIGKYYHFLLDHSMEWYLAHPDKATMKSEECRATKYLGDNVLNARYDDIEPVELINATETQGPTHSLSINMTAIAEKAQEDAQKHIDNSTYLGYPEKIPDPVTMTNHTKLITEDAKAFLEHQTRENNNIKNAIALCSILWEPTGNGTTSMRFWPSQLTNGFCDNFLYQKVWNQEEMKRIDKQIDLRLLIEQKIAQGDSQ